MRCSGVGVFFSSFLLPLALSLCSSVLCATAYAEKWSAVVMPEGVSASADLSLFNGLESDYAIIGDVGLLWENKSVEFGLGKAALDLSVGTDGAFSLNTNVRVMDGFGGRFEVGNSDWASSSMGINPTKLAAGVVFAASEWQGVMYLDTSKDLYGIGRVEKNSSFLSSAYYMTPRISYYTPKIGDKLTLGVSMGYGGTPSRDFLINTTDGFTLSRTHARKLYGAEYTALLSAGARYAGEFMEASLTSNVALGSLNDASIITSGLAAGFKVKGTVEFAASAGFLSNDPRIDIPEKIDDDKNRGMYADAAIAYSIGKVKLSSNVFGGASRDCTADIRSYVLVGMVGAEYKGYAAGVDIVPFVEFGVYRNRYDDKSNASDVKLIDNSGILGFLGLKASVSID